MAVDSPTQETATIVRLSDQLATALGAVIRSAPCSGLGPVEMARTLGVDKTLVSRLMTALRATDPLAALNSLPGTTPLRHFLQAAGAHGAGAREIRAAESELRLFEQELQRTFGTRTRLDAVIAEALPDTRRRHQESARQAVFRGLSLLKGVSIDLASTTWLLHPSRENPGKVDIHVLAAFVGVRRLRPGSRVRFASSHARTHGGATLLAEFCRPADLSITRTREGNLTFYEISTGPIRRDAAADVFLTESLVASPGSDPTDRVYAFGDAVAHPCKRLSLTILLHDEVWPAHDFSLRAYDTAIRGLVGLPDPTRDPDRLPLDTPITRTRAAAELVRSMAIPRYADMLDRLTQPLGWDVRAGCRAFHCELVYPLYGAQILLVRD